MNLRNLALSAAVCVAAAALSACGQNSDVSASTIPSTPVTIVLEREDPTMPYDALAVLSSFETDLVMLNALVPTGLTGFTFPKSLYQESQGIIGVGPLEDGCVALISLPRGTDLTTWDATRADVTIIPRYDPADTTGTKASNVQFKDEIRRFVDEHRKGCRKIA